MRDQDLFDKAVKCLACPACQGVLSVDASLLWCTSCLAGYPVVDDRIISFRKVALSTQLLEQTMYGPEYEELIGQIPPPENRPLLGTAGLDYGCGSSPEVFRIANADRQEIVFGLDYDLAPLRILARAADELGYKNVFLLQYDREDLPCVAECFDLVTSHQALEHVPSPDRVIGEIARRMKPGAIFRVDFPNGHSLGELLRELFHRLNRTRNPHISRISYRSAVGSFKAARLLTERFVSTYALRGPLVYFIEGFVLRFLMRKHKIYAFRNSYRSGAWFRFLGVVDASVCRVLPRFGQAFVFELRKPSQGTENS